MNSINSIPTLSHVNDIIGSMTELNAASDVTFTGDMKTICNQVFNPADYTYNNITLT